MLPATEVALTPEQIDQIEQARKLMPKLKAQIRKGIQAGIDLSTQETQLNELQVQLDKLYSAYVANVRRTPGG